jgi:ABC-type nitrate/sulfonate/bicarbonate transport system substrate-binding protein
MNLVTVRRLLAIMVVMALVAAACADDEPAATSAPPAAPATTEAIVDLSMIDGEVVTVTYAEKTNFDDMMWRVALDRDLFSQVGINFNVLPFVGFAGPQLAAGEVDIAASCPICAVTSYENFQNYRNFMITNQFRGFIVVGRTGVKTYADFLAELGGDVQAATRAFVESLRGTTFPTQEASFGLLDGLMGQADMTSDDLDLIIFPDTTKSGLAFIQGQGDFYVGGLAQVARMLFGPELEGQFVVGAPYPAFGPSGLWYSTMGTTQEYLDENPEVILRLLAVWYRATRYLEEKPEYAAPFVVGVMEERTGELFEAEDMLGILTELNYFAPMDVAGEYYFDPGSEFYHGKSIEFLFERAKVREQVPLDFEWQTFEVSEEWFNKLLARQDLVDWVNSPITDVS